jgi:uncharacterized membrane protein
MVIEHELTIDAPPEVVWKLTADIEGWPALTPTIKHVERLDDGPLRVGSRARVKQPAQRPTVWTVTRLEPDERFEWEATVLGMHMTARHHLTPEGSGCRSRLELELSGRRAGLLGRLVGARIRKAIATENEGFKKAAEANRPG